MKTCSGLFVIAVLLCSSLHSSTAQSCEEGSEIGNNANLLLQLLGKSPTAECREQMLALVRVQDFIAQAQTVFNALTVICETNCSNYVHEFAQKCVPSYVNVLGLACGRNEQDIFCYQTVALSNGTSVLGQCFPHLFQPTGQVSETTTEQPADSNATVPPVPSFECRNECRMELEQFRAFHGCCVANAFNSSAFGLISLGIANYSLWSACNVEPVVGYCPVPFTVPTTAFVPTTIAPTTTFGMGEDATTFDTVLVEDTGFTVTAHTVLILMAVLLTFNC